MFYDVLLDLCRRRGISPYRACTDIGLNRSAVAKWKTGSVPNGATAGRLADYFGVTTDYLLGVEERPAVTEEDIKIALFGGDGDITDEMYDEVRRFAQYVKRREAEKKE